MMIFIKSFVVSMRVALKGGDLSDFAFVRYVRVNFPDIGIRPVLYEVGFLRRGTTETKFGPDTVAQVLDNLSDLTMICKGDSHGCCKFYS